MSADQIPPPPPAPSPTPVPVSTPMGWQQIRAAITPYLPALAHLVVAVIAAALGAVLMYFGVPPKIVDREVEVVREIAPAPVEASTEWSPAMGWHRDPDQVATNLDPTQTLHFERTPAGKTALGDEDVFLWQAVRKAAGKPAPWYPNVNQQSVGCCVGCGWKHSADVCQATAIAAGKQFEWKPVSVEVIYAGSRVDVGGGRMMGDGSVGAWAAKYCSTVGGLIPMDKYPSADLTTFSPSRARTWGRTGAPADLRTAAKDHPVKSCALVKSWADVKRAIQQGYPVAVCSDQGFTMTRDSTGRAKPQGTWPHCMSIQGVRSNPEGAFILNSWGDAAHTGPVWPADMPVAGFWADSTVIDRMVRQGDSFALADVAGFPSRKIDWLIRAEPRRSPLDLFARSKLEVALSW